ncbi:hypothetical protein ABWK22_11945 [Gottfriedia acidiceleris]|uniref:hypothetical protein n=1 Tax=Bacillaceae TaxID=186817 RepID=UPI00159711ED|nr:hypothetical protein [Bacillus sp. AFS001701]
MSRLVDWLIFLLVEIVKKLVKYSVQMIRTSLKYKDSCVLYKERLGSFIKACLEGEF